MEIKVVSGLNCDGYEMNGKFYPFSELKDLVEQIDFHAYNEICWVKGKNVFAGKPVSDKFFEMMKDEFIDAWIDKTYFSW